jgi:hypothetical protein
MRNNNPGNIKYVGQAGTSPSVNLDQGDPQAVFASPEAGMAAMYRLLMKKYRGGKVTPRMIVAGQGGWTPGNTAAAGNVAKYAGIGADDDIGFADPARAAKFMRALMLQEHGNASLAYTDAMISNAIGGGGVYDTGAQASAKSPYSLKAGDQPPMSLSGIGSPVAAATQPAASPAAPAGAPTPPVAVAAAKPKKPFGETLGEAVAAMGAPSPIQLPQLPPVPGAARVDQPAVSTLDPQQTEYRRQLLAQVLMRLNQGSLVG